MKIITSKFITNDGVRNRRMVNFECECGTIGTAREDSFDTEGLCKSCRSKSANAKHSMAKTRPYVIWTGMKQRCGNMDGYKDVSYDSKWETFEGFWDDMKIGYDDCLSLDRIDPFGNYSKDNCRWATINTQNSNIRGYSKVSKEKNVYPNKGKWMVRFMRDGKMNYIGSFETIALAVMARDTALANSRIK